MTIALAAELKELAAPQDVAALVGLLSEDIAATITGRIVQLQSTGVAEGLMNELNNRALEPSRSTSSITTAVS